MKAHAVYNLPSINEGASSIILNDLMVVGDKGVVLVTNTMVGFHVEVYEEDPVDKVNGVHYTWKFTATEINDPNDLRRLITQKFAGTDVNQTLPPLTIRYDLTDEGFDDDPFRVDSTLGMEMPNYRYVSWWIGKGQITFDLFSCQPNVFHSPFGYDGSPASIEVLLGKMKSLVNKTRASSRPTTIHVPIKDFVDSDKVRSHIESWFSSEPADTRATPGITLAPTTTGVSISFWPRAEFIPIITGYGRVVIVGDITDQRKYLDEYSKRWINLDALNEFANKLQTKQHGCDWFRQPKTPEYSGTKGANRLVGESEPRDVDHSRMCMDVQEPHQTYTIQEIMGLVNTIRGEMDQEHVEKILSLYKQDHNNTSMDL